MPLGPLGPGASQITVIAAFVLKGRAQAIGLTTLFFTLCLLIPPLSILALALVALVGLRLGARPGLETATGASLILGLASLVLLGSATPGFAMLILWVPLLVLALFLRYSQSLALTLELALVLALVIPLLEWLLLGKDTAHWQQLLQPLQQQLESSGALSKEEASSFVLSLGHWLPALITVGFFLQQVLALFVARSWQAKLFNPGGFQQEFHRLRVSNWTTWIATALLIASLVMDMTQWSFGRSLIALLVVLFLLQGLAVFHALMAKVSSGQLWLIGIYALLLLALPYTGIMLAVTGFMDAWRDFRRHNTHPAA